MLKDKLSNLKLIFTKKTEGNNKKNIENLVVFLVLLIITIVAINAIWGNDKKDTKKETNNLSYRQLAEITENNINSNNQNFNEYNLEQSLEDILSKMAGVGKVDVLVTYSETSEIVAMYNETYKYSNTEEEDSNGGVRKIEETDTNKEIIKNSEEAPVTQKIIMPKVEGVVVTAEGAGNANIKTNIIQAVSAATGIASYRIQVFEGEGL